MNGRIVAGLAALILGACAAAPPPPAPAPPPPPPPTPDQQFEQLARRYLDEFPPLSPVDATALGDHRFDDRLDEVGIEGWKAQLAFTERFLAALQPIDRAQLSRANQVDALLLAHELEYQRWKLATLEDWRWNPLLYTRLAGDGLYNLIAREFAPEPQRLQNLGKRLDELPRFLKQERESLDPARVPKVHAETAVKQNAGLVSMLDGEIAQRVATLPAADQETLRASVTRARSALTQHQIWLEKRLVPEAKGDFRLGQKLYDEKLGFGLFSPLSRQEIRARAESELTATRAAMYDIARQVLKGRRGAPPLPEKPGAAQQQRAIRAALELANAERPARDGVLDAARAALTDATQFVRDKHLVTLPDEPLEIVEMPAFKQGVALAYCDSPGPLDAGQKTIYAVSPIPAAWTRAQTDSFLREYNSRSIRNLTVHEAMPGHYLQLAHANEYPSTLRAVLGSGPFVEGWAVYAERLMVDSGFGGGDPLMRLVPDRKSTRLN